MNLIFLKNVYWLKTASNLEMKFIKIKLNSFVKYMLQSKKVRIKKIWNRNIILIKRLKYLRRF